MVSRLLILEVANFELEVIPIGCLYNLIWGHFVEYLLEVGCLLGGPFSEVLL